MRACSRHPLRAESSAKSSGPNTKPSDMLAASQSVRLVLPESGVSAPRAVPRKRWLDLVTAAIWAAPMRSDARDHLLTVARILGWSARGSSTRPTRAATAARAGISQRTVSKHWRWLEARGWLHNTEPGTTAAFRPSWCRSSGNLAREWILTEPGSERQTSSRPSGSKVGGLLAPARDFPQSPGAGKKLSDKGRAAISARFLASGWLPADVTFAIDHGPDGRAHAYDDPVRFPRAHAARRLELWTVGGQPIPSRSQQRAARHVSELAEQNSRRERVRSAAESRSRIPASEWVGQLRAIVTEALRASDRKHLRARTAENRHGAAPVFDRSRRLRL
jgi:hypothetical protein